MSVGLFLLCLGLSARLTRLITDDRILARIRAAVITRCGVDSQLAYLIGCPWCISPYVAASVYTLGWFYGHTAAFLIVSMVGTASWLIGIAATWADPLDTGRM